MPCSGTTAGMSAAGKRPARLHSGTGVYSLYNILGPAGEWGVETKGKNKWKKNVNFLTRNKNKEKTNIITFKHEASLPVKNNSS